MTTATAPEIPTLSELDSSSTDYIERLDHGYNSLLTLTGDEESKLSQTARKYHTEAFSRMKDIEGIEVRDLPELDLGALRIMGSEARTNSIEARRRVEDIANETRRAYEDEKRTIEDKLITLGRAREDFARAIGDLTEIIPILVPDYDAISSAHFYVAHNGDVYELHANTKEGSAHGPAKSPYLKPENFSDADFIESFRQQSTELGAAVYFITNPSIVMTSDILFTQGMKECLKGMSEHDKQAEESTDSGSLLESVLKGIKAIGRRGK